MPTLRTAEPSIPAEAFAQAKGILREAGSAFDGEILQTLADAIDWAQRQLNVQLLTTTFENTFDEFPDDASEEISLQPSPLASVTSITYTDGDGSPQTWSAVTGYEVITADCPGYVRPMYEQEYPSPARDITISFTAGYGTDWSNIPPLVRRLVLMRVEELYRQIQLPEIMAVAQACITGDEFHVYL